MKILLLSDYAPPLGGAELMAQGLRQGLCRMGHDARLFTSSAHLQPGDGYADYVCRGTTSRFRTLLQTMNPWAYGRLRQVLADFEPDVVGVRLFLTQLSPMILPLLRQVPAALHVAWYRPMCPVGTKTLPDGSRCRQPFGSVCLREGCLPIRDWLPLMVQMRMWFHWKSAFDLLLSNSAAVKEELKSIGLGPVEVLWNGVPSRPARPPLSEPPMVACAGRLAWEKGIDVLLSAFAQVVDRLPQARLLIIGEGPEQRELVRLVNELGLASQVSMPGYLPREEMEDHIASAWVQVVPSRWAEPFGLVAAEGMMRGTAVIATTGGGLEEIVQDGKSGLLVPPGDVEPLASALLRLLQDRDLVEEMGRAGRDRALANFTTEINTERTLAWYEKLASGGVTNPERGL